MGAWIFTANAVVHMVQRKLSSLLMYCIYGTPGREGSRVLNPNKTSCISWLFFLDLFLHSFIRACNVLGEMRISETKWGWVTGWVTPSKTPQCWPTCELHHGDCGYLNVLDFSPCSRFFSISDSFAPAPGTPSPPSATHPFMNSSLPAHRKTHMGYNRFNRVTQKNSKLCIKVLNSQVFYSDSHGLIILIYRPDIVLIFAWSGHRANLWVFLLLIIDEVDILLSWLHCPRHQ